MMQIPEIKSFSDVRNHVEEINTFVKSFPLEDHVYYFPNPFPVRHEAESCCPERPGLGTFAMIPNTKDTSPVRRLSITYKNTFQI